ncbi:two-component system, chemotaxis family, response regulator CheY [Palleronia salina]|uniref:Two-component system, chemotaxis family, response regulator CheY n=1 Tax=Palleronia salina TaxID=313368 RepID=A0A1M6HU94_9RHOB|nr:response regulator [Palleronia salina]SHJ25809.1 two-component system, chemotaxis family, response regulator CheY [Palleronia salina]
MSLSILAIDDSRTMRDLLRSALEEVGFNVTTAENGADGIGKLESATPDVIITDINMPVMDGFGVIEAVRKSDGAASVPILVLSTESGSELKDRARGLGATGWIVKPFDDQRLISAIRRVARV